MGTITTGTGLISGLNIQDLVSKLIAIDKQPITLLQNQVKSLGDEKTAIQNISAQILALKLAVTPLKSAVAFQTNTTTSSNDKVLTAKANSSAVPGQYTYTVQQVAQSHQMISQGYADANLTAIGSGDISIEMGQGNLDRDTELSFLRNQQGIRRGQIQITDRSGASAIVDLSSAVTVNDILDKINNAGIGVAAKVAGDRFVLEDTSGSTSHNLVVQDFNGGHAAADLGLTANTTDTSVTGSDVIGLTTTTALKSLNDGNGIQTNGIGADMQFTLGDGTSFNVDLNGVSSTSSLSLLNNGQGVRAGSIKITNRNGLTGTVDLSGAKTVGDVLTAVNQSGLGVNLVLVGGTKFMLTDSTGGSGTLKVENGDNSSTATDLGLVAQSTSTTVSGTQIYRVNTLGDIKRAIEDAARQATNPSKLSVNISADGKGLTLSDTTGGTGPLSVASLMGSHAAEDLGIAGSHTSATVTGQRLVAGLNTVLIRSLNGGLGVAGGIIEIQNRAGNAAQVDLRSAQTVQDVIDAINNAGIQVQAGLNQSGTGLVLQDQTGAATANLRVVDVDSTTASDLHIAVDSAAGQVDAGNNELQYISQNTLLSQLNGGKGISAGSFTITDSAGNRGTITLNSTDVAQKTVGDLINLIQNQSGMVNVKVGINATGDGLLLTDTANGSGTLTVTDGGGTTASDLNIAKTAATVGAGTIDGSYNYHISVGGSDTLQALADKINALKGPFTAAIVNDGSSTNGYHLSLTSKASGRAGRMIINGGSTGLNLYDLVRPQDALVTVGSASGGNAVVATSSTNTFTGLAPGLTLTAQSASASPVTITVATDTSAITSKVKDFVDKLNAILSSIADNTKYDADTQKGGVLLGNYQVQSISDQLYNFATRTLSGAGGIKSLGDLGITIGSDYKLSLNESKFAAALAADPTGVASFFSTKDTGMAYLLDKYTDSLTQTNTGVLTQLASGYDDRTQILNDRISELNVLLTSKQNHLYQQFNSMEQALSKLQTMQTALSSLSAFSTTTSNSSNSSGSSS